MLSQNDGMLLSSSQDRIYRASPAHILLQDISVLFAGKLLPIGHTHHIRVNLQAVAVGIAEVKRATATATEVTAPLNTVDQWSIDLLR